MFDPTRELHVPYPLFVTGCHQILIWLICTVYLKLKGLYTRDNLNSGDYGYFIKYIIPTAIATAGDIGFGNISFKYVPYAVYTIIKASTIAFVLFFGCILRLEKADWRLFLIVAMMFVGVVCMGYTPVSLSGEKDGSEQSHFMYSIGVIMVVLSSALGGFRWVYAQVVLNHSNNTVFVPVEDEELNAPPTKPSKKDPAILMLQLSLPMALCLLSTSFIFERPIPDIWHTTLMDWPGHSRLISLLRGAVLAALPSMMVFLLTTCEFGILQLAPVLTLSISGIVKELLSVFLGIAVFHESLNLYNWIGMLIIFLDVCYYNYYRYKQRAKDLSEQFYELEEIGEGSESELDRQVYHNKNTKEPTNA